MRAKSLLLLALALGCGSIAAIGINQVLASRNQPPPQQGETDAIIVALADVQPGEVLGPANIKLEEWPKAKVPEGVVRNLEEIEGRRARFKVFKGEPILLARVFTKDTNSANATDYIPTGYRVVAVKVDDVSGASSLINPGDRVDVLVHLRANPGVGIDDTSTRTILQDVKVFAVNEIFHRANEPDKEKEKEAITARTISLVVTPEQAELVTLASEMGSIRLVLRSIDDDSVAQTSGAPVQFLLGHTELGDRDQEDAAHNKGPKHPLIKALDKEKEKEQPAPEEEGTPVAVAPGWKMLVLEGKDAREVELGKAGAKSTPWGTSTPTGVDKALPGTIIPVSPLASPDTLEPTGEAQGDEAGDIAPIEEPPLEPAPPVQQAS